MSEIRLEIKNVSKSFGTTKALQDVSFSIEKGKIHALIGEAGSGKTTLIRMLAGILPVDSGEFLLDGKKIRPQNLAEANEEGVSIIGQKSGILSGLTVAENIFLGHEAMFTKLGIKNIKAMNQKAQELVTQYGFEWIRANTVIDEYGFGDRKRVEIVKATYFEPKLLIIDETTTSLSKNGRAELYRVMDRVKNQGNTVLFISRDLSEVVSRCDSITILRDGACIDTVKPNAVTEDELKKLLFGREGNDVFFREDSECKASGEVALTAEGLTVPGHIEEVSFTLHKGEILGFGGLPESGMHEVGKAVFGASFDRKGKVTLSDGTEINDISTAIKKGIAYTSKDRDTESVLMNMSIAENICLPSLGKLSKKGLLTKKKIKEFAQDQAAKMSVRMVNTEQPVSDLSGGNKQKVVFARWLGTDADILVLDSPALGTDIKVKQDIYRLMEEMRKTRKSIILISEDLRELIGMCDRVLIMKDGKLNGELHRDKEMDENSLIERMV